MVDSIDCDDVKTQTKSRGEKGHGEDLTRESLFPIGGKVQDHYED